jgi:cellulose biosynthesis protein BcsQ
MDLAGRYQDILIDAGGRDSVELRAALVVAEHAFIPIQASQFDVWTLSRVNELVKTARGFNSGLRAFIVLSRISPNPSVRQRASTILASNAPFRVVGALGVGYVWGVGSVSSTPASAGITSCFTRRYFSPGSDRPIYHLAAKNHSMTR